MRDMDGNRRRRIFNFLRSEKLTVISTVDSLQLRPESALIAFTEDEHLCLYFQTGKDTRKAANLQQNPLVSMVFGLGLDQWITVQYEGIAEQLVDAATIEACKQRFVAKDSPTTEEYFNRPSAIFFKVTPTWIRLSDYTGSCPEVIELKLVKGKELWHADQCSPAA